MSSKRRSVSIREASYLRLFSYAKERGRSCSDIIEEHITNLVGAAPAQKLEVTPPSAIKTTGVKTKRGVAANGDRFNFGPVIRRVPRPEEPSPIPEGRDDLDARPKPTPVGGAARAPGGALSGDGSGGVVLL